MGLEGAELDQFKEIKDLDNETTIGELTTKLFNDGIVSD